MDSEGKIEKQDSLSEELRKKEDNRSLNTAKKVSNRSGFASADEAQDKDSEIPAKAEKPGKPKGRGAKAVERK